MKAYEPENAEEKSINVEPSSGEWVRIMGIRKMGQSSC